MLQAFLSKTVLCIGKKANNGFDTLFDADFASNNANWQWVAGCGLDAAPYFRIFNPVLQSDKFEAAEYIRKYVPELTNLSDKFISKPWEAKTDMLEEAKVETWKRLSLCDC